MRVVTYTTNISVSLPPFVSSYCCLTNVPPTGQKVVSQAQASLLVGAVHLSQVWKYMLLYVLPLGREYTGSHVGHFGCERNG